MKMKITDIKTYVMDAFRTNWTFVKVETDEGLYGWGEASLGTQEMALTGCVEDLKRLIVGRNPLEIEKMRFEVYRDIYWKGGPVLMSAISGIEMAMWDIMGKYFGVPTYTFFGGKIRDRVKMYANGWFSGSRTPENFARTLVANFILEGVYFYSGFMFFYNLGRNQKMPGSAQEIRYITRDESTHLWLFRNIIRELQREEPQLFTPEKVDEYRGMIREGAEQEIAWGCYVIGNDIPGLTTDMVRDYIRYLANRRCQELGFAPIYPGHETEPPACTWVSQYSNANLIKTDFFEARSTAYAKSTSLVDDL